MLKSKRKPVPMSAVDVLLKAEPQDRPEMDVAEFFESGRYTLSVNSQPVMQGVRMGLYPFADPDLPVADVVCPYCGHRLGYHFTSTSAMTTSVGCGYCSHNCVIWSHFDRAIPNDSVIGYEREEEYEVKTID